jgi:cell division septal protein FtsQ
VARETRRVKNVNRPRIYGRPQPVRNRRSKPEVKINFRAVIAIIVLVLFIVWWWRTFSVKKITVSGSRNYPASLVSAAVKDQLKAHWWWHNLVLLNPGSLQKKLLASQPQLSDVAISRQWPSGLNLKVSERNPNIEWRSGGKTYLLSQEGIVVAEAGNGGVKLPVVEDTTNLPVKLGDQVAPARFVAFCLELVRLMPKQGLQVTAIKVPATTNEVNISTNQGYFIKFDTTRAPASEVGDLAKVLNLLKTQNKRPSEYIDLRIDGAAYYK